MFYHSGECDHLEPFPTYSEMQHHNINLTTWDKPWLPEIDWFDSYLNLSTYEQIYLEGLTVGFRISKHAKYYPDNRWGCFMIFQMDSDLADAYYLEHYANTNASMAMCTPHIPVYPYLYRDKGNTVTMTYIVNCFWYEEVWLKRIYHRGDLSYIWSTSGGTSLHVALVAAALITLTGVLGE